MDLEKLNNYVQIVLWTGSAVIWGRKKLHDEKLKIPALPLSTKTISIAIGIGLLISSTSLYFSYRPRIVEKTIMQTVSEPTGPGILRAWGASNVSACAEAVNATSLIQFQEKYGVATACGIIDPTVDKFEDQRITVSALHTIVHGEIDIATPYSQQMFSAVKKLNAEGVTTYQQWNEVLLLPKGTPTSEIRKLSDVHRYEGKILSIDSY
ncbi:MAG: hypothetical protein WAO35_24905 [Terriglobia bacterium]